MDYHVSFFLAQHLMVSVSGIEGIIANYLAGIKVEVRSIGFDSDSLQASVPVPITPIGVSKIPAGIGCGDYRMFYSLYMGRRQRYRMPSRVASNMSTRRLADASSLPIFYIL